MAGVLDINIICNKVCDLNIILLHLFKYKISIESVNCIDNWQWDNEKEIMSFKQISILLETQHIIIIKLKQPQIKDMGMYIEKISNKYLYTLWINTDGFPMFDCEKVTLDNYIYYKEMIQTILEWKKSVEDFLEIVGIGLETDIYPQKNIEDIILKSKNMIIWIFNKENHLNIQIDDFKCETIENMYILQKGDCERIAN